MTIQCLLPDITNAIANLSIPGVTIKDKDEIAGSFQGTTFVLYPNPEGFITNFSLSYKSFTRGENAQVDILYTLNYRYLSTLIGDPASMPVAYSGMIDRLILIIAKMIETTAPYDGRIDLEVGSVTVGARVDPAGNGYHGADIALKITEMQNT